MHTANHIADHCISGDLLKDRTIILVTHHVSLCLPRASFLVELSNGRITHQGTIEELRKAGLLGHITDDQPPTQIPPAAETSASSTPVNEADIVQSLSEKANNSRLLKGKLVQAEARAEGRVKTSTYLTYLRAGGWIPWSFTFLLLLSIRGITIGNQVGRTTDSTEPRSTFFIDVPRSMGSSI